MPRWFPFVLSMLCANTGFAESPAALVPPSESAPAASALVDEQLVQPLRKAESKRKRFSRAAPVPKERRVRVLDASAQTDARGRQFVRFAVDVLYPWDVLDGWHHDVFLGCAYLDEREVFVKRGNDYLPAKSALGKRDKPHKDVCRPAPAAT